jgi:hypothetical protein
MLSGKVADGLTIEESMRDYYGTSLAHGLSRKHTNPGPKRGGKSRCLSAKKPNATRKGRRRR